MSRIIIKVAVVFISIILVTCLSLPSNAAQDVPQQVIDACYSVVRVEAESVSTISSGSGFVIKNDRNGTFIVTNAHVISDGLQRISVWVTNEEKQYADVEYINEQYDLAIIRLERTIKAKALILSTDVFQGMSVYAVGYPAAADNLSEQEARVNQDATITDGLISATRTMRIISYGPEISILQINADINHGNSGGPLLNSKGEVIGVNTLGVADAQGIFGAIASSELLDILDIADVDLDVNERSIPWWVFIITAAIIICALVLILFLTKRHRKSTEKPTPVLQYSSLPLIDCIKKWPENFKDADIVALLIPLAIQLRDMHLDGKLYLKLSPHVLNATADGIILSDSNPPDFTIAEFTSPEQFTNGAVSLRSDIYTFFRVLDYLKNINRDHPERDTDSILLGSSEAHDTSLLEKAILRGLSTDADARFSSMQDVIYELAPLNHGIPRSYSKLFDNIEVQKKDQGANRRNAFFRKPILIIVLAIVWLFLGFEAFCYVKAEKYIETLEFTQADEMMRKVVFVHKIFPDEWAYLQAGVQMSNGNYDIAIERFTLLDEYKKSAEYVDEAKYRKAAYLADQGQFTEAAEIYKELTSYRDSAEKYCATMNRYAYYLLESEDYNGALNQFNLLNMQGYTSAAESMKETYYYWACSLVDKEEYISAYKKLLMADDYSEVAAILPSLKELAYYNAVDLYDIGKYRDAETGFSLLGEYLDTNSYLILIKAHTTYKYSPNRNFVITKLLPLIGFEDASEILLSNWSIAQYYLEGKWSGGGKYLKFIKNDDGSYNSWYNIPWFDFGDYFNIVDGYYVLEDEDTYETRKMYKIAIINQDCITVYAYKNSSTYTLYRQG